MSVPKRHHYLPKFYLNGFCRDDLLYVYDRKKNEIRRQPPVNTAIQGNYYTLEDFDGNKDTQIEAMLSEIEGAASPIIDKATNRTQLSAQDKEELALFLAFLMNRVPDFEKSINRMEEHLIKCVMDIAFGDEKHAAATLGKYKRDTGNSTDINPAQVVNWHRSGKFKIDIHRNESLRIMLQISLKTANWFNQMDWIFLHAPDKTSFVTSDNPVYVAPPDGWNSKGSYGHGLLTKGTTKVVPLNQHVCLLMFDHGDKINHIDIDREQVRLVNYDLTMNTDRFLIGRDYDLVNSLYKRMRLSQWQRRGKISIGGEGLNE
jgi:hypothetical protein